MRRELSPAVIVTVIVIVLIVIGLFGWRALGPGARGGAKNPYENMPPSARGLIGSQGRMGSGGPMSGGPMSGGPTSGGPAPQSGGAPTGGR